MKAFFGLALALVAGCVTDSEPAPPPWQEIELTLEPVGRFVRTDYSYGYRVSSIKTEDGPEYVFDDEFRSPDSPVGPLPVDCDETRQIGVWLTPGPEKKKQKSSFAGRGRVHIYAKQMKVDVQWSHSERPEGDSRYHWRRNVSFGYRFVTRLNLSKKDRTDGVMTLNVLKGDEVLYTTSFQLMGCGLR